MARESVAGGELSRQKNYYQKNVSGTDEDDDGFQYREAYPESQHPRIKPRVLRTRMLAGSGGGGHYSHCHTSKSRIDITAFSIYYFSTTVHCCLEML